MYRIAGEEASGARAGHKDLRHLIVAGKVNHQRCRIFALQHVRVDVKIAGEVQMSFDGLAVALSRAGRTIG